MDVVRAARDGQIAHDELVATLTTWSYAPRVRVFGGGLAGHCTDDSLDAVDVAHFDERLLTRAEYASILFTARR